MGTQQCSFERYHPDPLWPPFHKIGRSQPQPKSAIAIISGMGKAVDFKFGRYIHRVHLNKSPSKILEKWEPRHMQGVPKIFWVPLIISGMGTTMNFKYGRYIHRVSQSEQKPMKNSGTNGAWGYPGTAQIFWVSPTISGTGKATNFKFGSYIHRVHPNKSPWKNWEKREHGRIQWLSKFFQYPLLSQEWEKLWISNFVRTFIG